MSLAHQTPTLFLFLETRGKSGVAIVIKSHYSIYSAVRASVHAVISY